jgi:hypothetical protein
MAQAIKSRSKTNPRSARLAPALKEFLDLVVIPALVKEFLREPENRLALAREDMTHFAPKDSVSTEGVQ